ncbi:MAG TPA: class I SAM-dependent methyltransferase [Lacunisphaera sp.]|nr:class I SAM-dependent methyltransferase [Lacunisphaera sp.]
MPDIQWNQQQWGPGTDWSQSGDGWSNAWGGPDMQWHGSLFPRVHRYLPAGTILEIACGFGRWTHYLKDSCQKLIAVDLVEKCVEACKVRFADSNHISYFVNDGKSLDFVADGSVDFVFSFDSLVHVEPEVIKTYVSQLPRILRKNGTAFIHHSNLGSYPAYQWSARIPKLRGLLSRTGFLERSFHNREPRMSAALMEKFVAEAGMSVISQETVNWRTTSDMIDCFSVIANTSEPQSGKRLLLENPAFMVEAAQLVKLAPLYGRK